MRPSLTCPELVWRHFRWPETEAGQVAQLGCPADAVSSNPSELEPVSFACLETGQWASRVEASRCQSSWLRNLTQRLELGDSALSILAELSDRTKTTQSGWLLGQSRSQPSNLFGDDLVQIARVVRQLSSEMGEFLARIADDKQRVAFAREFTQVSS